MSRPPARDRGGFLVQHRFSVTSVATLKPRSETFASEADITEIARRIDEAALSFERLLRHRRAAEHRQRKGGSHHESTHVIPS